MKPIVKGLAFIALLCLCLKPFATSVKDIWLRWQANNSQSTQAIDYSLWEQFLKNNVQTNASGVNVIDYAHVTREDRQNLQHFLNQLSNIKIGDYNRNEQLAFWINLYNALTISTVLNHYPVKSIRDIKLGPGWFKTGPWDAKLITVEGVPVSLNDIEHRIIRPIWDDPRTHYAVNCAAYGCPNLQKIPFTGSNVDELLDMAAQEYVNDPRGLNIDNGRLVVSDIYIWYKSDFGQTDQDVIDHLIKYANPELQKRLSEIHAISGGQYDWSLNQPTKP